MAKPLVSICIPTFKRYEQLELCLENALSQDYGNIEVLVSDDTQDEPVPDWLLRMVKGDGRLRYVRQPVTLGIVPNNSFVRKNAKGDYLCVMHNDDTFPKNYLTKMMELLDGDRECVLAGPACSRHFNGSFWYDYESYNNNCMTQFERLSDIAVRAFEKPWNFEHLMYGVAKRGTLPETFHFGHWRSIIVSFYLYSIKGTIRTAEDVKLIKNTTTDDIRKYSTAGYVIRYPFMEQLFSQRQEERLTVLCQLILFTMRSSEISISYKARLAAEAIRAFKRDKPEFSHPSPN